MPRYKMSYKKCHEPFPGDSYYQGVIHTFEAASDEEATKKADEFAGKELNIHNVSISYHLEEYRDIGSFTKTKTPTQFPRVSSAGLRGAKEEGRRQLRGR